LLGQLLDVLEVGLDLFEVLFQKLSVFIQASSILNVSEYELGDFLQVELVMTGEREYLASLVVED